LRRDQRLCGLCAIWWCLEDQRWCVGFRRRSGRHHHFAADDAGATQRPLLDGPDANAKALCGLRGQLDRGEIAFGAGVHHFRRGRTGDRLRFSRNGEMGEGDDDESDHGVGQLRR
jgi:hypothetical protein